MCELGRLYSKESILEYILDRTLSDLCSHIKNQKSVKELKLTPNPGFNKDRSAECHDQYFDTQRSPYVCPVVGLEMNGKHKFCALWGCGCVISERAMKEVETDICHNCGEKFHPDDVIIINAEDDDLVAMETNMKTRRERAKATRKSDKKAAAKKRAVEDEAGSSKETTTTTTTTTLNGECSKSSTDSQGFEVPTKIPKREVEQIPSKKASSGKMKDDIDVAKKSKDGKKKKKEKSSSSSTSKTGDKVPKSGSTDGGGDEGAGKLDPKQSSVYKKLFTSGAAKPGRDNTAHWVT